MDQVPCEDPLKDYLCPYGKPDLWQSNTFAWQLFQECSSQVITAGMGEILGIDYSAIDFLFRLYKIEDEWYKQCLFEKIITIDRVRVLELHKKNQRETDAIRNKTKKH